MPVTIGPDGFVCADDNPGFRFDAGLTDFLVEQKSGDGATLDGGLQAGQEILRQGAAGRTGEGDLPAHRLDRRASRRAVGASAPAGSARPPRQISRHFRDTLLAWLAHYRRRQAIIDGDEALADIAAHQALIARRRDAAATALPDWDQALKSFLYDPNSASRRARPMSAACSPASRVAPLAPVHDHGPSIRWLWAQAKALGLSEPDAWRHVMAWCVRRPAAWQTVDRSAALIERREQKVCWRDDGDPDSPWTASVDGAAWRVRLNDFPDQPIYGLMVGDRHLGDFHDWPQHWHRD